ncbi:hypothetical protein QYE76_025855 [Lolium multiflorum]|uniref:Uncharacterized protein n=1 Tax=Lolium multiflorum TaxID=4521 RepID=A0AAD8RJE5_LOLMU|nr:hypothetical protein QYE76_025855 [Lolium multiflorum]
MAGQPLEVESIVESQVDSTRVAGHPPHGRVGVPLEYFKEVVIVATWENNHEDSAIDLDATPTMMGIMPVDDGDHVRALEMKIKGAKTKGPYHITYELHVILEADLQKRFEHHDPHELVNELKAIFETHAAVECYEASKHFFSCMMEEGSSVSEHMLAMTGHAKKLSDLGIVIPNRLGINRVLQSLPPSYKNFVMNYNMQNMNKELPELFAMLKSAEVEIKKEHQVLMVNKTTSFKKQGKSKGKFKKGGKKAAMPHVKPKTALSLMLSAITARRRDTGRNCSKYLADLKSGLVKKKKEGISIYML